MEYKGTKKRKGKKLDDPDFLVCSLSMPAGHLMRDHVFSRK